MNSSATASVRGKTVLEPSTLTEFVEPPPHPAIANAKRIRLAAPSTVRRARQEKNGRSKRINKEECVSRKMSGEGAS
jgi:hypothetical protein